MLNPLDEDAAIIARIDREMENGRLGYQSPSAVSQIEKLRREHEEKSEIDRQKREAEEKEAMEEGGSVTRGKLQTRDGKATAPSRGLVGVRTEPEWVKKYRDAATEKEFPDITNVQRLVPRLCSSQSSWCFVFSSHRITSLPHAKLDWCLISRLLQQQ